MRDKELIYFADPMCSWCWGFAPVIEAVQARFGAKVPLHLIMGGLYPGTEKPLTEKAKATIREHWDHVHEASGQPFDFDFFDREQFVYNTEPPSRAVVAVRRSKPGAALPFLRQLHHAFYAGNRDVTDRDVLSDIAQDFGAERAIFQSVFDDDLTLAETRRDFAIAKNAGIGGFPTLIGGNRQSGYLVLTQGFQPWPQIEQIVERWIDWFDSQPDETQPEATPADPPPQAATKH